MDITRETVIAIARDLRTEPGDSNPEYDRALADLAWNVLGLSEQHESREAFNAEILATTPWTAEQAREYL